MAWDASRPVPWQRLFREWLVYVAIMAVVFLLFFRDRNLLGIFGGLLASLPLYLAFGYLLAKLGYQRAKLERPSRRDMSDRSSSTAEADDVVAGPRPKPPPTKRTGGGGSSRPGGSRKRRR